MNLQMKSHGGLGLHILVGGTQLSPWHCLLSSSFLMIILKTALQGITLAACLSWGHWLCLIFFIFLTHSIFSGFLWYSIQKVLVFVLKLIIGKRLVTGTLLLFSSWERTNVYLTTTSAHSSLYVVPPISYSINLMDYISPGKSHTLSSTKAWKLFKNITCNLASFWYNHLYLGEVEESV